MRVPGWSGWRLPVAVAGVFLALILRSNQPRFFAHVVAGAASALLLALLDRFRGRLTPLALRAGADLVLLTPACLKHQQKWLCGLLVSE